MQLHELKPIHKRRLRRRVGRGGTRGSHCGRGRYGQKSRTGRLFKPAIREFMKKYPKLRGYKFNAEAKDQITGVVNLKLLDKKFGAGETVNPKVLLEKRLVRRIKGETPLIKILGTGEITKALVIENCLVSKQAKEKIEKANGSIK